ncbi:MAG TPA: four helix bundle protein [Chitinophagaceae bacterium]|jgi:four helix bundle protein|nr:four helix bundle protein [Chitinophagaceae bacterium]HMU57095.1 four helix bundle protein [Chitinophagaceae bacterium]
MATIKRFEEIDAWKVSRELCSKIGTFIDNGQFKSSYKLINQIESSSGSIMDNIAEGFERGTRAEFIQFLGYSKGSCGEFRSQLYRAVDRNYLSQEQFDELYIMAVRVSAMIQKLIEYLQKTEVKGVRKK